MEYRFERMGRSTRIFFSDNGEEVVITLPPVDLQRLTERLVRILLADQASQVGVERIADGALRIGDTRGAC